ncbi:MAG: HD-GYP domain-containing protein [Solirubrobacteraceae bacterium]
MDTRHGRPRRERAVFTTVTVICAVVAAVVLVLAAINHEHFGSERLRHLGLPLLGLVLLACAAALWAWREEIRGLRSATEDAAEREAEARRVVAEERAELQRLRAARETQQRWTRELRSQVSESHREHGVLGSEDVRGLVLRIAMGLLDAEKGLLLAREDADGDGNLDLVRAVGFEHDPAGSAVTQRLAGRVLDRDEILHEDDGGAIDSHSRTPADEEIENLVAIPVYIADDFSGVVVCANRDGGFADCDDEVLLALGDHTGAILQNGHLHGQLRNAYLGTVALLSEAIAIKDPLLKGHSEDVATLVGRVAHRLGIPASRREELLFGSLLHDVGKLGVSERILLKPAALTPEERSAVELHPRIGYRMIQRVPALRPIAPAVLHHHERYDGEGYPNGLRGEAIPLEARIIAVADSYSAMTSDRPYRKGMPVEAACDELVRGAGTQWDPQVIEVFVDEVRRREASGGEPALLADPDDGGELDVLREADGVVGAGAVELTDALTLLYSHRYLHEAATAEARRAALQGVGFTIVVGELAALHAVNRDHGFARGDELLRTTAAAFERAAAACPNAIPARLSGCRLALMATGLSPAAAQERVFAELCADSGVLVRTAAWQDGDDGFAVIARAKVAGVCAPAANLA